MSFQQTAQTVRNFLSEKNLTRHDISKVEIFGEEQSSLYIAWGKNARNTALVDFSDRNEAAKAQSLLISGSAEPFADHSQRVRTGNGGFKDFTPSL
jgi:hypothetical protein